MRHEQMKMPHRSSAVSDRWWEMHRARKDRTGLLKERPSPLTRAVSWKVADIAQTLDNHSLGRSRADKRVLRSLAARIELFTNFETLDDDVLAITFPNPA